MYQVKLNGGIFDCNVEVDWERLKIMQFDVYLNGIWLNDLFSDKTLEYFQNNLQEQLEYSLAFDPVDVQGE